MIMFIRAAKKIPPGSGFSRKRKELHAPKGVTTEEENFQPDCSHLGTYCGFYHHNVVLSFALCKTNYSLKHLQLLIFNDDLTCPYIITFTGNFLIFLSNF